MDEHILKKFHILGKVVTVNLNFCYLVRHSYFGVGFDQHGQI